MAAQGVAPAPVGFSTPVHVSTRGASFVTDIGLSKTKESIYKMKKIAVVLNAVG